MRNWTENGRALYMVLLLIMIKQCKVPLKRHAEILNNFTIRSERKEGKIFIFLQSIWWMEEP